MVSLVLAVACSGPEPTDTDGGNDGGSDTGSDDTGTATGAKRAVEMRFWALLGWDADVGGVVSVELDGETVDPLYVVALSAEGASDEDPDSVCYVVMDLGGLGVSDEALADGFAFGLDVPGGGVATGTDCEEKGFDGSQWDEGSAEAHFAPVSWQLRMGGELTPDLVDWLTPDDTSDWSLGWYAAGDWSNDGGYTTDTDDNYWYGWPIDAAHLVDSDQRLVMEDAMTPAGLVSGYYVFDQRAFWNLE